MNLHSQGLNVIGTVGTAGKVGQIELNLVPTLIQSHGHGTNEGLHTGSRLIVRRAETTSHVLVVQNLDLEGEVFLELR